MKLHCETCNPRATILGPDEIESLLAEVEGWQLNTDDHAQKLTRTFATRNYPKSISFTNGVAELAETANHHPVLIVEYSSVTVIWWSHSVKGLCRNDFIMASKTSELF
jgi:4a-hydroxytetrahydrobiopterin dehydratase